MSKHFLHEEIQGLFQVSETYILVDVQTFYLVEKAPEAERQKIKGEFQVRVEREVQESSEVYRLQVASLANAEDAENLGRTLAEKFSMPVVTRLNPSTRTTQVRLGAFSTRGEAQSFARGGLSAAGYSGALLVRETTASGGDSARLAVRSARGVRRPRWLLAAIRLPRRPAEDARPRPLRACRTRRACRSLL